MNPVSETNSRPACGEKDYFFPNDPNLYAGIGPIVKCDVEDGLKREFYAEMCRIERWSTRTLAKQIDYSLRRPE